MHMKKTLLFKTISVLCIVLLFSMVEINAQTPFWTLDFESAGGYTTSVTEFTDAYTDYFLRTDGSDIGTAVEFLNVQGSYYFAAQDIDAEGETLPVELNIENIDISGLSQLYFSIYLAEDDDGTNQDWDDLDYVHILYDIDNSGTFKNLLWIENDGSQYNSAPLIDTDFDGTGDGTEITSTFTPFLLQIPELGSEIDIKIIFNLDSGDEDIALDNIQILGPDTDPPVATFDPLDAATGVFVTSTIAVTFDEPVRNIDDSEITDANVASLLVFKETNISGTDVPFTATIDANKKVITLVPDAYMANSQVYFVAIAPVEDGMDNATTGESITFTTIDAAGKEIHVEVPAGGETYYAGDEASIEWYSSTSVTTVNIDAWVPSEETWITMVPNTISDGAETFTIPADAMYSDLYKIRVIDVSDAEVVDESPTFTVIATPTIYLIQSTMTVPDASDFVGQRVRVTGVVTAIDGGNFWLQDGAGAYNGIMGYDYDAVDLISVGDNVTIDADVTEYTTSGSSETELSNVSNLVVNSSANPLPDATVITTGTYGEEYEAVLVKIVSAEVVSLNAQYGEFTINDGSGDLVVDDKIYAYTATLNETIGITGIGHDEYGDKILPRSAEDVVDLTAPTFTSVPGDSDTDVAIDASVVITFNEAIRNLDDSEITDANVAALITFKETDGSGADVAFTATIDAGKEVITIVADANFDFLQVYYVGVASVEDANDNAMSASSFTFTAVADQVAPVFTSVPDNGATEVAADAAVTITFDEPIRNTDDSEITDANVATLITFKETDDAGADVAFTATIDAEKKVITITPDANLAYAQVYYVAIAPVEDDSDNATSSSSFTFTTMDDPSSINEVESGSFIEVYPNPNHGKFMLRVGVEEGKLVDVEIMNIQGQIVYRDRIQVSSSRDESIDLSDKPSGLYFIRVTDGGKMKFRKILID